ncbi:MULTISPECIES: TetR/AcrR family transcriptional regulator [Microbacterium]|uniref:TetR/AcrR family transcriptional regulator n=1 Tax=Microbacterium maritypicum TaxID=33918 RepID=A0AAD3ZY40_MICMQ|nr:MULTISPECIES: TetR/AcrR family transcriptional regulator [Microbacterium]AZS45771.1 HTH-type transcriptional regulator AcrR [Microbacterium oxydans]KAB1883247.1 TetR/AcrR family transcriptional regulator [Microbacterium liquefaciens]KQV00126.1 TetR family transcriptional regulator [Microbacterium sp. Root322]KQY74150.1 TetR family transcriptional regulator [Microbacterium sp. Root1433D1]WKT90882.1 TetR/AcrR family transcriptional regulator [Microbacterium liquefaciens]
MSDSDQTVRVRPATLAKREQILKAAVEIFGNKGSTNGTLADVAEQVGITHAGVLHHFGSKQKLLLEVLAYRDQADVAELAEKHIPGGPELFLHLVRTAFANEKRPGIVQAYTVLSAESVTDDHPARDYFEERYTTLRREVTAAFHELCAQEGVRDPDTIAAASAAILAVMDGLQLQWLLHPGTVELGETSEFAIQAIVNAVLRPGPQLPTYVHPA